MGKADEVYIKILAKDGTAEGIGSAERRLNTLGSSASKMVGMFAGVFAVDRMARFTVEMAKLGGEVKGVEDAFYRIADKDYLASLKESTKGTVTELGLMKRAVQANNFDIPLTSLASLFAFATKRAQQTGESVDYLVNSIIMGIGRKSPLILDNLGISAVQLRQRLKGVGTEAATVGDIAAVVGEIAAEAMEKSGGIIDETNIKVQQVAANWDDVKASFATSEPINNTLGGMLAFVDDMIKGLPELATILKSDKVNMFDFFTPSGVAKASMELALEEMALKQGKDYANFMQQGLESAKPKKTEIIPIEPIITVRQRIGEVNTEIANLQKIVEDPSKGFEAAQQAFKDAEKLKKELKELKQILSFSTGREASPEKMKSIGTPTISNLNNPLTVGGDADMTAATEQAKEKLRVMYAELQAEVNALNEQFNFVLVDGLVAGMEAAISGASFSGVMKAMLTPIASVLEEEGKILIVAGLGIEAFKKSLATLNGVAAIATGALLIGAAQGLKALGNTGGGGGGFSGATAGGGSSYSVPSGDKQGMDISGKFEIEGPNLVYILDQQNQRNGRLTN